MSATGDSSWEPCYRLGLRFYAERLFNPDGAPRWMSDRDYPHDIHGAAQGILTFCRHVTEYPGLADRVARWAIRWMYSSEGRFYYQQTRFGTRTFTLLRWCNAWMFRALSEYVACGQYVTEHVSPDSHPQFQLKPSAVLREEPEAAQVLPPPQRSSVHERFETTLRSP